MMSIFRVTPKERVWNVASILLSGLTKLLPLIIIFISSTQLGLHFWPSSALVYGVRVDYLAPTLYFLDCLILIYLLILPKPTLQITNYKLQIILPLLLTNLLYSQNPASTFSWSLHFLLYYSFISILFSPKPQLQFTNYKLQIVLPLFLSLIFQVALALIQVSLGHSVDGLLYYLGERTVSVGAPNIATGTFLGQTVLRAYGTFSHPNILAGWLVISFLILIQLRRHKLENWRIYDLRFIALLVSLGLFLTQSRSAALAFFGLVIPLYLLRSWRTRLFYFVILLTTSYHLLTTGTLSRALDLSISQRISLQQISFQTISHFPFFGTGANASISTYPSLPPTKPLGAVGRLLQPDHNSFTLLLSWFGLFGILSIIPYLQITNYKLQIKHLLPLFPLLLLDHYLLTSPQGLFVLLLYLTVVNSTHVQTNRQ